MIKSKKIFSQNFKDNLGIKFQRYNHFSLINPLYLSNPYTKLPYLTIFLTNHRILKMYAVAFFSFFVHSLVYLFLRIILPPLLKNNAIYHHMKQYDKDHLPQIIVSIFHAIVAAQGSIRYLVQFPNFNLDFMVSVFVPDVTVKVDDTILFYLEFSVGYFLYDLFVYLLDIQHVTWIQIIHHVIASVSYGYGVYSYTGTYAMLCLLTNEISTPFLHFRYILKTFGFVKSLAYKVSELLFIILFFFNRIVFGLWILFAVYVAAFKPGDITPLVKGFHVACCTLHVALQVIWLYQIYLMVKRKKKE